MKGNLKGKLKKGLAGIIAAVMTFAMVIPSSVMTFAAINPDLINDVKVTYTISDGTVKTDATTIEAGINSVVDKGTVTVTGTINEDLNVASGKTFTLDLSGAKIENGARVTFQQGACVVNNAGVYSYAPKCVFTAWNATATPDSPWDATINLFCSHHNDWVLATDYTGAAYVLDDGYNCYVDDFGPSNGVYTYKAYKDSSYTEPLTISDVFADDNFGMDGVISAIANDQISWTAPAESHVPQYSLGDVDYDKNGAGIANLNTKGEAEFYATYYLDFTQVIENGEEALLHGEVVKRFNVVPATTTSPGTADYDVLFTFPDNKTAKRTVTGVVEAAPISGYVKVDGAQFLYENAKTGAKQWVDMPETWGLGYEYGLPTIEGYSLKLDDAGAISYRLTYTTTDGDEKVPDKTIVKSLAINTRDSKSYACGAKYYKYQSDTVNYTGVTGVPSSIIVTAPEIRLAGVHSYATIGTWNKGQIHEEVEAAHDRFGVLSGVVCDCGEDFMAYDTLDEMTAEHFYNDEGIIEYITPKKAGHTLVINETTHEAVVGEIKATCVNYGFKFNICKVDDAGWTDGKYTLVLGQGRDMKYTFTESEWESILDKLHVPALPGGTYHPVLVAGSVTAKAAHTYIATPGTDHWTYQPLLPNGSYGEPEDLTGAAKSGDNIQCWVPFECPVCGSEALYIFNSRAAGADDQLDKGSTDTFTDTFEIEPGFEVSVIVKYAAIDPSVAEGADCSKANKNTYTVSKATFVNNTPITTTVDSTVCGGVHTYKNTVAFAADGKSATVTQSCTNPNCKGYEDKDGNKHTQIKVATVTSKDNEDGSTTYTATLDGVELTNNTRTYFDLTRAEVVVNEGKDIDLNLIDDEDELKAVTKVTIGGVAIPTRHWDIEIVKPDPWELSVGENVIRIVPTQTAGAAGFKEVIVKCIQPKMITVSPDSSKFDGKLAADITSIPGTYGFCGYYAWATYDRTAEHPVATAHTFEVKAKDNETMQDLDAPIKYAVVAGHYEDDRYPFSNYSPIMPAFLNYDLDSVSVTDVAYDAQGQGVYFVYAQIQKEGYTTFCDLVGVINIIPQQTNATIMLNKQVLTYGEKLTATTGNAATDELISLSTEDTSKMPVGVYGVGFLVKFDQNYAVQGIAGLAGDQTVTIEKRNATIIMKDKTVTYTGKKVDLNSLYKIDGAVNGDKLNIVVSVQGGKDPVNAGKYTLIATANDANYNIETVTATLTIKKAAQKFKSIKPLKKTYKAAKLAKKAQSFKVKAKLKKGNGKITFKKVSGNANVSITSGGKVVVKKGTYKSGTKLVIKVKVTAAATPNYAAKTVTKAITITVK